MSERVGRNVTGSTYILERGKEVNSRMELECRQGEQTTHTLMRVDVPNKL